MNSKRAHPRGRLPALLAVMLLALCIRSVCACNVPVFRYALERWSADHYRGVLFHRGPLAAQDEESLSKLRKLAEASHVNLGVRTVDVSDSMGPADNQLFESIDSAELPMLVVQYPAALQIERPVWNRRLSQAAIEGLLESKTRQETLARLASGQTAVWLMVDSGNEQKDKLAADTLERELKVLHDTLKLPELTDSPEDAVKTELPLRIEFSLIRIQRNDDSEHALISMLLGSEPDLASINGPIVFPVFGRGRCLLPLVDAGISPENIRDSSKFLVGGCSCTVKQLNPGFDMLVTADWSKLLKWSDDAEDSPNGARSDVTLANGGESVNEPEYVTIPSGDFAIRQRDSAGTSEVPTTSPLDQTPSSKWTITLLGVVVVTILLAVIRKSIF